MKRIIVLTIVMLMVVPGLTKARSYCPVRYRVRWSPYAFGLVSGDIKYSPYAFRVGHNGLVPGNVRYSPYAFSCKHPSGLVADPGSCYFCYPAYYTYPSSNMIYLTDWPFSNVSTHSAQSFEEMKKDYQEKVRARKARIKALRDSRKEMIAVRENDGWRIICDYLKSKNIDFKIRNRLCIQGKTLCSEFLLGDGYLIKYRNPKAIERAIKNPRYEGFYKRYEEGWTEFCKEYTGRVYEIKFVN